MTSFVFADPWFLYAGGSLLLLYWGKLFYLHRTRPTIFFSQLETLKKAKKWSFRKGIALTRPVTISVLFILFTFVLARPQIERLEQVPTREGIDILIALDVSESMLAEDLDPNRLEAAKTYIHDFLGALEDDRAGIIVFAGKPFSQSPLTFDYPILQKYLKSISVRSIDQRVRDLRGTAIGDAILVAKARFKSLEERTKVLILVTDGDANIGINPILAAKVARESGIKIYTIGVGRKEGAPIPIGIENGEKVYATGGDGTIILTAFNEKTLRAIAQASGGAFFYGGDNATLDQSLQAISQLEKQEIESEEILIAEDQYFPYLLALMAVYLLYLGLEGGVPEKH